MFRMEYTFCRRCGAPARHVRDHIYTCGTHTLFRNSQPATCILLTTADGLLVTGVRGIEPHKGAYDFPGGFVDGNETFEAAIERELKEELGLSAGDYTPPQYLVSGLDEYYFQGEPLPVITVAFTATLSETATLTPADDVADVAHLPMDAVPVEKFCFPSAHQALLALQRRQAE